VPPYILAIATVVVAMPNPQVAFNAAGGFGRGPQTQPQQAPAPGPRFLGFNQAPAPASAPAPSAPAPASAPAPSALAPGSRFLGFNQPPQQQQPQQQVFGGFGPAPAVNINPNQQIQNFGAGAGLGGVAAFAGANCLFHQNCDLSFRPSLGAAVDANGQIVPQLGVTTQVGDGRGGIGTTFTGGLQLDGKSESGIGGFVAGGLNDGNADGVGIGAQTGFGFSQNSQGSLDATAQLGGNVQAPQLAGVQFNRPNTALGIQPTVLGQAQPQLNLLNLFGGGRQNGGQQGGFNLFGR